MLVALGASVLCLGVGAAVSGAQEMQLEDASSAPSLVVEHGRAPGRAGFAVEIAGGVPFGHALLAARVAGREVARGLVRLDAGGGHRYVERNWDFDMPVELACSIQPAAGGAAVTRTAIVPSAADLSQGSAPLLGAASIVITEIMKDPSFVTDGNGEWFEVRNLTSTPIDLTGWVLSDAGSNQHTINSTSGPVIVPRHGYFLLGVNSNSATNGGLTLGYRYTNFTLGNGADEIRLTDNLGTLVDIVSYDDGIFWPDEPGKSLSLNRALVDPVLNDDGANWCSALAPFGAVNTDLGTPRVANNNCP